MNEMFVPSYSQMLKNKIVCVPSVFPRIKKALTKFRKCLIFL